MTLLQSGIAKPSSGYDIEQSLRFDDGNTVLYHYPDSAYSDGTRWTLSTWIKLEGEKTSNTILLHGQANNTGNDGENRTYLGWWWDESGYRFFYNVRRSNAWETRITFTPQLSDFSAWYHVLFVYNSNESSADDRIKFYLNGVLQTDRTTTDSVSSGATSFIMLNGGLTNVHGHWNASAPRGPGYLADFHWIDGQALTTADFGETDSDTNQWKPIEYAGTYGNSGFYFKFQDSSNLGDDSSGNGHDFTNYNLVATDVTIDSPTNNFATLNPLIPPAASGSVFSEGNLKYRTYKTGGDNVQGEGTIGFISGKWYWEIYLVGFEGSTAKRGGIGVGDANKTGNETWTTACTEAAILSVGNLNPQAHNVVNASTGSSWSAGAAGDIWCCAFDADAGTFIITKNTAVTGSETDGKWTGFATSTVGYRPITVEQSASDYTEFVYNFGQDSSFAGAKTAQGNTDGNGNGDFYYSPPTGYLALCTDNLSDPSIADPTAYFNSVLYTGTGGTRSVTGVNFSPDLTWIKSRSNTYQHMWFDSVRGATHYLVSDAQDAEATDATQLTSFDSDGFSLGGGSVVNGTSATFVGWNWKGGGAPTVDNSAGAGATPTAGSVKVNGSNYGSALAGATALIRGSANTNAGFSAVTYVGNGTSSNTFAHLLSQAPKLIITKNRDSGSFSWATAWQATTDQSTVYMDTTAASFDGSNQWNSTEPTATLVSVGASSETNSQPSQNQKIMAYCFHSVENYSRVGSYTGNGASSGPFVYTGFRPAFIFIKRTSSAGSNSYVVDNKRIGYNGFNTSTDNGSNKFLWPDSTAAEGNGTSSKGMGIDLLSNGFKLLGTGSDHNADGDIYIYYAVASTPFKTAHGV